MTGEEVFDQVTQKLNALLPEYEFQEFVMPGGEVQRWWTGNNESVIIRYKDDRKNIEIKKEIL